MIKRITIEEAVAALGRGELVVVPTETVYGLAADGNNAEAVEKLYQVKGRPKNKPIMLQIADVESLSEIVTEVPVTAKQIIECFWPGPISIVLKKKESINPLLSAGTNGIGVRMPAHPLTLQLLKLFKKPLAVPSANLSGEVAPIKFDEVVIPDPNNFIAGGIDGGECDLKVASTVLDLTDGNFTLLREGVIKKKEIEQCLK